MKKKKVVDKYKVLLLILLVMPVSIIWAYNDSINDKIIEEVVFTEADNYLAGSKWIMTQSKDFNEFMLTKFPKNEDYQCDEHMLFKDSTSYIINYSTSQIAEACGFRRIPSTNYGKYKLIEKDKIR